MVAPGEIGTSIVATRGHGGDPVHPRRTGRLSAHHDTFALVTGTPPSVQVALALRPAAKQVALAVKTTVNATNVGSSSMATQCESAPVI